MFIFIFKISAGQGVIGKTDICESKVKKNYLISNRLKNVFQ